MNVCIVNDASCGPYDWAIKYILYLFKSTECYDMVAKTCFNILSRDGASDTPYLIMTLL
jgi:hypothetical protein